jgi:hypothetical protein
MPFAWFTDKHSFYSEERASKIKEWLEQKPQIFCLSSYLDSVVTA